MDGGSSLEGALAIAVASAEVSAMWSRCTWPNEMASWNASASSARYAPHLERDRNQLIVVTLHPLAAQTHSAGTSANGNSVTFAKMRRPSRFLSPVAENQHCKLEPARCSRKTALARIRAIQDWQEIRLVDRTNPVTAIKNRHRSGSAIEVLLAFA